MFRDYSRVAVILFILAASTLAAQGPRPKRLAFDVGAVKANNSGTTAMRIIWPHGRFSAVNVTARHWEQKPQTVYALILAKPNGSFGPNPRRSHADCAALFAARRPGSPLPAPSVCGVQRASGTLIAGGYVMAQIADTLASVLQNVVVNRTGLDGMYDVGLTAVARLAFNQKFLDVLVRVSC